MLGVTRNDQKKIRKLETWLYFKKLVVVVDIVICDVKLQDLQDNYKQKCQRL